MLGIWLLEKKFLKTAPEQASLLIGACKDAANDNDQIRFDENIWWLHFSRHTKWYAI